METRLLSIGVIVVSTAFVWWGSFLLESASDMLPFSIVTIVSAYQCTVSQDLCQGQQR